LIIVFSKYLLPIISFSKIKQNISAASLKEISALLTKETGISSPKLLHWAKRAELMKIRDLGRDYSDLLEAVGVESVSELKRRNPESLHESMSAINNKQEIVDRMPSLKRVTKWIEESKDIDIKVSS